MDPGSHDMQHGCQDTQSTAACQETATRRPLAGPKPPDRMQQHMRTAHVRLLQALLCAAAVWHRTSTPGCLPGGPKIRTGCKR